MASPDRAAQWMWSQAASQMNLAEEPSSAPPTTRKRRMSLPDLSLFPSYQQQPAAGFIPKLAVMAAAATNPPPAQKWPLTPQSRPVATNPPPAQRWPLTPQSRLAAPIPVAPIDFVPLAHVMGSTDHVAMQKEPNTPSKNSKDSYCDKIDELFTATIDSVSFY